jgi:subtilisin-like proprotein convertase family protein
MIYTVRWTRNLVAVAAVAVACLAAPLGASASTNDFANPTAISGPGSGIGASSLDPSPITVAGEDGVVTDVNVFLDGVGANIPLDFEVLLVAPFGQKTVLMNDTGGNSSVAGLNLAFNDESAMQIPAAGPLASQGYKPTDTSPTPGFDMFLSPAPATPYGFTLDLSDGTDPNGTWNLYVDDDANAMPNLITIAGGWRISITTTDPPPPATPTTPTPTVLTPATTAKKKCKKGFKLKKGKCKRKKKR